MSGRSVRAVGQGAQVHHVHSHRREVQETLVVSFQLCMRRQIPQANWLSIYTQLTDCTDEIYKSTAWWTFMMCKK